MWLLLRYPRYQPFGGEAEQPTQSPAASLVSPGFPLCYLMSSLGSGEGFFTSVKNSPADSRHLSLFIFIYIHLYESIYLFFGTAHICNRTRVEHV